MEKFRRERLIWSSVVGSFATGKLVMVPSAGYVDVVSRFSVGTVFKANAGDGRVRCSKVTRIDANGIHGVYLCTCKGIQNIDQK